jgi:hypothetical protein
MVIPDIIYFAICLLFDYILIVLAFYNVCGIENI